LGREESFVMSFNVKRYFQVLGISLAVILCVGALGLGCDFSSMLGDITGTNDGESALTEAVDGKINVLLMCADVDGLRTDAIMLAQYDTEQNKVSVLSIPRDTRVYVGNRYQKINAAHAFTYEDGKIGGPEAVCGTVSRLTGVPINYYVDFSFDSVAQVMNNLGPVNFDIPDVHGDGRGMVYDDPVQGLHINLPPGNRDLNGSEIVHLLRYRQNNKGQGYPDGDIGRIRLQQEFIRTLVDQKLNVSIVLKLPAIFKDISETVKTNLSVSDVVKYSKYLTGISSLDINTVTLPGVGVHDKAAGQSMLAPNMNDLRILIQQNFGYDAMDITVEDPERQMAYYGSNYQSYYNSVNSGTENQYGHKGRYNRDIVYSGAEYNSLEGQQ